MILQGSLFYSWSQKNENSANYTGGGFVTALLEYLLRSGQVDTVFAAKKGADIYDAKIAIIEDPDQIIKETSGTLYCGTFISAKMLLQYLESNAGKKIALVLKGCDAKAVIELSKRHKVDMNDLILIGLTCSGTINPIKAREMAALKFFIPPDEVKDITFSKGRCIFSTTTEEKGIPIDELEKEGYGRRLCCQRCTTKIPRQCDIVCGSWGVIGEYSGNATFVEICSKKGSDILEDAVKSGAVGLIPADENGIAIRKRVEEAMLLLSKQNSIRQFVSVRSGNSLLEIMMDETSRCIKCYQCIEACPICVCHECQTKKPWLVKPGQVPPPFMFHLIRISHVADSCVNCGQCEDRCPMEIRNSLFMNSLQDELKTMFGYNAGSKEGAPVVAKMNEHEEWEHHFDDSKQVAKIFEKKIFL